MEQTKNITLTGKMEFTIKIEAEGDGFFGML